MGQPTKYGIYIFKSLKKNLKKYYSVTCENNVKFKISVSINKVLLECSHAHIDGGLWPLRRQASGLSSWDRDVWPMERKTLNVTLMEGKFRALDQNASGFGWW